MHRVKVSIDPRNTKSIGLMDRLKLRKEVRFKESLYFHDAWVDDVIYSIL